MKHQQRKQTGYSLRSRLSQKELDYLYGIKRWRRKQERGMVKVSKKGDHDNATTTTTQNIQNSANTSRRGL